MIPNLFILGAPKCATTALARWLSFHPSIYAPPVKEPHHFSDEYCLTPSRAKYEDLYASWASRHRWAFDASVWSLFSDSAVPNILQQRPDACFIVMLRNPLKMIPSMHRQQIFNGNELEQTLSAALAVSDRRWAGHSTSVLPGYPSKHLAYYRSCALGWQVERLLSRVRSESVLIVLHDDLEKSPDLVLSRVFSFLGLDPVFPERFERVHAAKVRPAPQLDRVVKALGDWKHRRGIKTRLGLLSYLRRVNKKRQPIKSPGEEFEKLVRKRLMSDVRLLSACIGRDLTGWLAPSKE